LRYQQRLVNVVHVRIVPLLGEVVKFGFKKQ
jgi:hypothetical protein